SVRQGIVLGIVRLDEHASRRFSAARPAGDLRYELKGSLGGAKIRQAEAYIDGNNTDKGYVGKIVPFRDHLRADEHIDLASIETEQNIFHLALVRHRVAVNALDTHLGETLF